MEDTEIHYAYLQVHHVDDLCELYKTIFNKIVTPNYFISKYGLAIPAKTQFSTVAIVNKKVVGFFGFILHEFGNYAMNDHTLFLQTCDFFILRSYRKGMISKSIFDHSIQLAIQHDIHQIYAFNSDQSYKVCKKLGFTDNDHFVRFHLHGASKYLAAIVRKFRLESLKIKQLEHQLNRFKSIKPLQSFNRVQNRYTNNFALDFFEQKNFCKHYQLELNGCILYLKHDYILSVGFCHFTEQADPVQLLRSLKRIARKCMIHDVVFHVQENSEEAKILQAFLPAYPSFKISSLIMPPSTFDFSKVQLHFMDMDVF